MLGIVIIVNFLQPSDDEYLCDKLWSMYNAEYYGTVTNKIIDSKNHNNPTIQLLSEQDDIDQIILSFDKSDLYRLIQIGDTIYKSSKSIEVYLNGQLIKIDYGVECEFTR